MSEELKLWKGRHFILFPAKKKKKKKLSVLCIFWMSMCEFLFYSIKLVYGDRIKKFSRSLVALVLKTSFRLLQWLFTLCVSFQISDIVVISGFHNENARRQGSFSGTVSCPLWAFLFLFIGGGGGGDFWHAWNFISRLAFPRVCCTPCQRSKTFYSSQIKSITFTMHRLKT